MIGRKGKIEKKETNIEGENEDKLKYKKVKKHNKTEEIGEKKIRKFEK